MKKMNKKGFTIVELVIVIAVIAILAAVMIPTFGGIIEKANESDALQTAKNTYTNLLIEKNGTITETPIEFGGFVFTFDTNGTLTGVAEDIEEGDTPEFTYTVSNGVITSAEKQ
ncbi:MAG: type II secretion system protein [Clostridia bacterium]|nr:type II secretion system protein [Clostridia bacterium]